jgi:glutathione S-transferase
VTVAEAIGRVLRSSLDRFPAEQRNEKAGEAAKTELFELWQIVARALDRKEHLVGDHFTLADLAGAALAMAIARFGVDLSSLKNSPRAARPWAA